MSGFVDFSYILEESDCHAALLSAQTWLSTMALHTDPDTLVLDNLQSH